jgi:DNA-binding NtrC family response regulator
MKKHILVVDDEADIRELLNQFLTNKGYRLSAVATADEAQRLAASDPPQLVISDLQLEDSDGLEMISHLKKLLPDTPMMLLTGVLIDSKVVRESLSGKVASYLQKTTPLAQILEEVRRLIGP